MRLLAFGAAVPSRHSHQKLSTLAALAALAALESAVSALMHLPRLRLGGLLWLGIVEGKREGEDGVDGGLDCLVVDLPALVAEMLDEGLGSDTGMGGVRTATAACSSGLTGVPVCAMASERTAESLRLQPCGGGSSGRLAQ